MVFDFIGEILLILWTGLRRPVGCVFSLYPKYLSDMKHKVKVTVIDTKLFPEYQQQYCANPCSGKCPVYNKGDEFVFFAMMSAMIFGTAA